MPGTDAITSTFANAVTPPASTFANGVTPPASSPASCGLAPVSIIIPCVGAAPVLASVSPAAAIIGAGVTVGTDPVTLVLVGTNFTADTVVAIAGLTVLTTQLASSTQVTVTVAIDPAASLGNHAITATNAFGTSDAIQLSVTSIAGLSTRPGLWLEADAGISDASGAALTTWQDRSGNSNHTATMTGYSAPTVRSSGFGGISGLPYLEFNDLHGIVTPYSAALDLLDYTAFFVFLREAGDANSAIAFIVSDLIVLGIQDSAASWYLARWATAAKLAYRESSYNVASYISKNVRHVLRAEWDGATHAGNKVYLEGVNQAIATQLNTVALPMISGGAAAVRLGFRDASLPGFNLQGKLAACVIFQGKLSAPDTATVEAYLTAKWLPVSAAVLPRSTRGPITLATQVIDGVTIDVLTWADVGAADFGSIDTYNAWTLIRFSEPIKRFRATAVYGNSSGYRPMWGVRNFVTSLIWDYVCGTGFPPNVDGYEAEMTDTSGVGFTHVLSRINVTGGGISNPSVFRDCYFSKLSDP
jgi:hypothetical protein